MKGRTNSVSRQDVLLNGMAQGSIDQNEVMKPSLSLHQADVYYVGKVGHVGVDFNATYYAVKNRRNDEGFEISKELGNQEVHSSNRQNSDMWAGKLVVNIPLWKGNMSVGTEMSKTDSHGTFLNEEQLVPSTKTDIHERNIAGFAQYGLVLNKWTVGLGVRYENIVRDYLSDGVKQDDVSRKYNNFFLISAYHGTKATGIGNLMSTRRYIVQAIGSWATSCSLTTVSFMKVEILPCNRRRCSMLRQ